MSNAAKPPLAWAWLFHEEQDSPGTGCRQKRQEKKIILPHPVGSSCHVEGCPKQCRGSREGILAAALAEHPQVLSHITAKSFAPLHKPCPQLLPLISACSRASRSKRGMASKERKHRCWEIQQGDSSRVFKYVAAESARLLRGNLCLWQAPSNSHWRQWKGVPGVRWG